MPWRALRPGRTVWRLEQAGRAAVLVDAAAFFAAVRQACLKARRRIVIVGWDIDSRTPLIGDGRARDGLPVDFRDFLAGLVTRRPELRVDLLLWDYSLLYAHEREPLPRLSLQWQTPPQVTLCLDASVPFGSSQHQKIVVIDDALALSGGLDITIRRWDTPRHEADEPRRIDPAGTRYRPFHDVQMMVDGPAAAALALLARTRWCHAQGGVPAIEPCGDPWPDDVRPDFADVEVGIARTQPRYGSEPEVQEVRSLFLASIASAQRFIYIENQFITSAAIADGLARQLRRQPNLKVVIVAPRSHDSFMERRTMRNGRIRFWRTLRSAGGERVRLLYPHVEADEQATDTMIHSKVMAIDDWFLRIGSANLNNRSMGADTECDLAVEAAEGEAGCATRDAIACLRNRLLGEHCGVSAERVAAVLAASGSLVHAADTLSDNGHSLRPIDDGKPDRSVFARLIESLADPLRPLGKGRWIGRLLLRLLVLGGRRALRGPGMALAIAVLAVLCLTLAWQVTDLSQFTEPARLRDMLSEIAGKPWAVLVVMAVFLVGGAVAFPVTMLILATAAVFGPLFGTLYAALGVALSAAVMFTLGRRFGQSLPDGRLGGRGRRVLDRLRARGLLAVVAIRVVPVAPFTLTNLACGAAGIRPLDFALGTLIGMSPGLLAMALLGDRLIQVLLHPAAGEIGLLALCVVGWLALSFAAQALVTRLSGRPS
ncbi:MAG: VTT domain-containing protein [Reyranella sp.]|uniref:VTT domain-containing protein n=1 Tax=Reyranella sp. TaxID=1929291 RepID=UPI003D0D3447